MFGENFVQLVSLIHSALPAVPLFLIAMAIFVIAMRIGRPDPAAQLAKAMRANNEPENPALAEALRMGQVGEQVGYDNDLLAPQPKLQRTRVQTRVTPLPRYHLFGTVRKGTERMAIFTTGRRVRSEGKIVREGRYGHFLVEKHGNRMWVAE